MRTRLAFTLIADTPPPPLHTPSLPVPSLSPPECSTRHLPHHTPSRPLPHLVVPNVLAAPPQRPALPDERAVDAEAEGGEPRACISLVGEEAVVDACGWGWGWMEGWPLGWLVESGSGGGCLWMGMDGRVFSRVVVEWCLTLSLRLLRAHRAYRTYAVSTPLLPCCHQPPHNTHAARSPQPMMKRQ